MLKFRSIVAWTQQAHRVHQNVINEVVSFFIASWLMQRWHWIFNFLFLRIRRYDQPFMPTVALWSAMLWLKENHLLLQVVKILWKMLEMLWYCTLNYLLTALFVNFSCRNGDDLDEWTTNNEFVHRDDGDDSPNQSECPRSTNVREHGCSIAVQQKITTRQC